MAKRTIKAAVVGASSLIGRELLDQIAETAPTAAWDLQILAEGDEAEGQLTSSGDEVLVTHTLTSTSFDGLDLVFFAGQPEQAVRYVKAAVLAGVAVVDLTRSTGQEEGFIMRSPWIDQQERPDLTTLGITVPHPAALILSLAAARLQQRYGSTEIVATVLEPASQAGAAGVDELHQQTVSLLSFQDVPKQVFGAQVAFNLQATLGSDAGLNLGAVRRHIEEDISRVLGSGHQGRITFSLLQAPVFHGYVISAHVKFGVPVELDEVRKALAGVLVSADQDTQPSNQAASESSDLLISVGDDRQASDGCWLLMAADNLQLMSKSAVALGLELIALRPAAHVQ